MIAMLDDIRTEALFVSDLQSSQQPTAEVIRAAVGAMVDRLGEARVSKPLRILEEVGLAYLRLGQPLNFLSGGESQRLKLVSHLTKGTGS